MSVIAKQPGAAPQAKSPSAAALLAGATKKAKTTSVHVGEVFCFWETERGAWNYIGDGINGARRVLAAIGKKADDLVFVSGETRESLNAMDRTGAAEALLRALHNRGRRIDKHGKVWRVYELNHTDLTLLESDKANLEKAQGAANHALFFGPF